MPSNYKALKLKGALPAHMTRTDLSGYCKGYRHTLCKGLRQAWCGSCGHALKMQPCHCPCHRRAPCPAS